MKTAMVTIKGVAPLSWGAPIDAERFPRNEGEDHDVYDARIWREKAHYDPETRELFLPAMAFQRSLTFTAQKLGMKIPGRRGMTWTSLFETGIIVPNNAMLGVRVDDAEMNKAYVDSNGKRGSGTRVWRRFPQIPAGWTTTVLFEILNDDISEKVFREHIRKAGIIDGMGRYRPGRGGIFGRYGIADFVWEDNAEPIDLMAA